MSTAGIIRAEKSHLWQREQHEHYVEPDWCSLRLFEEELFTGNVWDPACGFGRIPKAATHAGFHAIGSDVVDRGYGYRLNFLTSDAHVDNIISNPPFDLFRPFAERALKLASRKVAMIWLVRTLPAARWLQDTPLSCIWFLTPRPSMPPGHVISAGEKPGGGKQDFCWLVWDRAHVGAPKVKWLLRDRAEVEK